MLSSKVVIPSKDGIQCFCNTLKSLDSGFHRNDDSWAFLTFDEFVIFGVPMQQYKQLSLILGHLADKYQAQMIRYRTILQSLFGERPVECYLLFVDEPHRIVTVP
jgi:hypothetical protein